MNADITAFLFLTGTLLSLFTNLLYEMYTARKEAKQ